MNFLLTLVSFFLISIRLLAEPLNGIFASQSYVEAKKAESQLKFTVESTKVGLFSSDVDGFVKTFSYSADIDKENFILRDIKLSFKAIDMDSDSSDRDSKLHHLCMEVTKYPNIKIRFERPIFLRDKKVNEVLGIVSIRGKEKSFKAKVQSITNPKGFKLRILSDWSLKEMEIPDPSILVAKLSDEIKISVVIDHKL